MKRPACRPDTTHEAPSKAISFWPEWCPAFRGIRFKDGEPSVLDKSIENRPNPPWSTIAPHPAPNSKGFAFGPWVAMHAGKHIGGKPGRTVAGLNEVAKMARTAGWSCFGRDRLERDGWRNAGLSLVRGEMRVYLHADQIVTSAIVGMFRCVSTEFPGLPDYQQPWRYREQYGWHLHVLPFDKPIPCGGKQGLWTLPPDVIAAIRAECGSLFTPEVP